METLNTNASANISASTFFSELMHVSTDIVWKNQTLANSYENNDNYVDMEIFIAAKKGILTFDTIHQFDYASLIAAGLNDSQAMAGMDSKDTIPISYRNVCVSKYITNLLSINPDTGKYINYEEKNNYYRMLYGLPDYEDTEFLYNTLYPDINQSIPIHELSLEDRYRLEERGYLQTLLEENPTKKYLKFMTNKSIDPYVARSTERFGILWMNSSSYDNLVSDFVSVYNDCRYNIIKVYYTDAFKKDSDLYEGFMAMCILFMTIQLMHYKYLDVDITRDFYDLDSIKYIYDSYSVPFYSSIPLEYHKKIVKNINRLFSYKGSTRVFFDLFDLFDYSGMDVYEYYLLRLHKFENGHPIFIKDANGNYDYKAMYDIKFAKVRLYDNPPMEISDSGNHIAYETITAVDPFWVSDEELLNKLYTSEFNYLETKYVGIQTLFDMTKIMYESAYFFKMLQDNKIGLSSVTLYVSTVARNVNIFTLIIYICSLICVKFGYQGNISSSLPVVSKLLGFDFKQDLATVRANIMANPYMKNDTTLLNLLRNMNINNLTSINTTFSKITDLRNLLTNRKFSAKSKEEFYAYYNLERTILTADLIQDAYKKKNGNTAETFADLLLDLDANLYIRLTSSTLDVNYEIDVMLALLNQSFSSLDYIEYADGNDISSVIEHLFKILNFFKSAKSELTGYNIVYVMSSRGANMMKFMDELNTIREKSSYDENLHYLFDLIKIGIDKYNLLSQLKLSLNSEDKLLTPKMKLILQDQINELTDTLTILGTKIYTDAKDSNIDLHDIIKNVSFSTNLKSVLSFYDKHTLLYENLYFDEFVTKLRDSLNMADSLSLVSEVIVE